MLVNAETAVETEEYLSPQIRNYFSKPKLNNKKSKLLFKIFKLFKKLYVAKKRIYLKLISPECYKNLNCNL